MLLVEAVVRSGNQIPRLVRKRKSGLQRRVDLSVGYRRFEETRPEFFQLFYCINLSIAEVDKQNVSPKRLYLSAKPSDVPSLKTNVDILITLRICDISTTISLEHSFTHVPVRCVAGHASTTHMKGEVGWGKCAVALVTGRIFITMEPRWIVISRYLSVTLSLVLVNAALAV